jgi:hypothetical protein
MKFKIHFEFRASLRNFKDLNFCGAINTSIFYVLRACLVTCMVERGSYLVSLALTGLARHMQVMC